MTRLNDLQNAAERGTKVRWDPQSVDVLTAVQTARRMRARHTADLLSRGLKALARLSGATALFSALGRQAQRRRTRHELIGLSDRELRDIGLDRSRIDVVATEVTAPKSEHRSVWHMMADWTKREYRRIKTIRELSAISDRMLLDIGIEPGDIRQVAAAVSGGQAHKPSVAEPKALETAGLRIPAAMVVLSVTGGVTGQSNDNHPAPANQNHGHPSAA